MDAITPPHMLASEYPMQQGVSAASNYPAQAQGGLQAQMAQALVPEPVPVTHDVTIVTTKKLAQAKVLGVPPEEFGIERGARDIKTCNYCFHDLVTKTAGQLIAEGYDEDQINALGDLSGTNNTETLSRDSVGESFSSGSASTNTASRLVKITEHYVRMDYKGDGRPCLYMVVTGGDQGDILRRDGKEVIEPIDVIPFAATTPVPIPHRFFGRSMADLVMPSMREKTALKRGALDNLYLHNNPRVEVSEQNAGPNTLDDLLVSRPGGVVRTKTPGGLNWQVVPDITGSVYPMMQYIDAELASRTGLSKQSQGIDANALQNQSATAVAQVFDASQMRIKLIARVFAEGVRDIFALLHHTIRSHGQEKQTVRLRNQWVPVDPRNWKTRDDMTINVGLGTGNKAQMFAQAMALLNIQKELLLGGKSNLVGDQELFNSVADVTKIMGHRNPDKYINDPSEKNPDGSPKYPPPPPPADPKIEALKLKAQTDQAADERKAQIEQVQAQADIATQDRKTAAETAQMERDFDLKAKLAMMQAQLDAELKAKEEARKEREFEQKMAFEREKHAAQMKQGALGIVATAISHDAKMEQGQQAHEAKMAATPAE